MFENVILKVLLSQYFRYNLRLFFASPRLPLESFVNNKRKISESKIKQDAIVIKNLDPTPNKISEKSQPPVGQCLL